MLLSPTYESHSRIFRGIIWFFETMSFPRTKHSAELFGALMILSGCYLLIAGPSS